MTSAISRSRSAMGCPSSRSFVTRQPEFKFDTAEWQAWYGEKEAGVCVNSGKYDGLAYEAAVDAVAADLKSKGVGEKQVRYRLRDWGISRQRYWGTPIPIIHCEACGPVPVPEKDLPVVLPEDLVPDGSGNPLNKDERFLACSCPKCGKPARRETDTMDTFVDSAWYYMRYCCPDADRMVDERVDYWMPMDQYIGGIEHAVLHLLYARFWTKVMRDMGLVKFDEPFTQLFTQGMLLAECFYREDANGRRRWFYPAEVDVKYDEKGRPTGAVALEDGKPVLFGGIEKMSKSKNNVVEPRRHHRALRRGHGARVCDVRRPARGERRVVGLGRGGRAAFPAQAVDHLSRAAVASEGAREQRFAPVNQAALSTEAGGFRRAIHVTLKQALHDYERLQYNTVVSACMKMLNEHRRREARRCRAARRSRSKPLSILLRTLYPIAPHVSHVLWKELGFAQQARRPAGCAVAASSMRSRAGAGRDRGGRAGERQAARPHHHSRGRGSRTQRAMPRCAMRTCRSSSRASR